MNHGGNDNRIRSFSDVVSIDAWHQDLNDKCSRADLHAHVVFGEAKLGGEQESPVRFRLSIRRAEIVVVISETEPLGVDPASVTRDLLNVKGTRKVIRSVARQKSVGGAVGVKVSAKGASGEVSAKAAVGAKSSASEVTTLSEQVSVHIITQSKTTDGFYRWIVAMQDGGALSGAPWDGTAKPRLTIVDQRTHKRSNIPPSLRVEVRCSREDLIIEDLELKDESKWNMLRNAHGAGRRIAAAEGYLLDQLTKVGLEVSNISDKFGTLVLASATASTSGVK